MYKIHYHQLVLKADFKHIPQTDQKRIVKSIDKKLSFQPEIFGKPLQKKLKGYYRLRLDPYRVIYRIDREEIIVFIVKIGLRKDFIVYLEAAKRLQLIS